MEEFIMKNEITYTEINGINYPNLTLPEQPNVNIGKYGQMRLEFLKKHRRGTYTTLLTGGRISAHLSDIDQHEVGIMLTNFGQSILMQVTKVTYEYPVLMVFKGYVNGKEATLLQHINQLNFMLTSIDKEPDKPKRKIGFVSNN